MSIYADSSFFVSFYLQDGHVDQVNEWMASLPRVFLTPFQQVELVHAVYQHVFRTHISMSEAQVALAQFEADRSAGLWIVREDFPIQFDRASGLAERFVPLLGTRTLDTLHVAAALELRAKTFWSFDKRQLALAQAAGLGIPSDDRPGKLA